MQHSFLSLLKATLCIVSLRNASLISFRDEYPEIYFLFYVFHKSKKNLYCRNIKNNELSLNVVLFLYKIKKNRLKMVNKIKYKCALKLTNFSFWQNSRLWTKLWHTGSSAGCLSKLLAAPKKTKVLAMCNVKSCHV